MPGGNPKAVPTQCHGTAMEKTAYGHPFTLDATHPDPPPPPPVVEIGNEAE